MRPLLAAFALLLLGAPVPALASGKDTVPDWVHAAVAAPTGKLSPEAEAVVLLSDTTLTVTPDGKATEHHREIVKILRPGGRERGVLYLPFDRDTKILNLHVWSIGPDGHEYAVKDSEMAEVGLPGNRMLYEDIRFRTVEPPGRDPGGVIAYEYEQRLEPYLHETTWHFQDDLPRRDQHFTLELPPGYTYRAVWTNRPAAVGASSTQGADLEHGRTRWELAETPAIDLHRVTLHPAMRALEGRMTVHFAAPTPAAPAQPNLATWPALGVWYDGLTHDRLAPSPEITSKAAALTAGKTDFYDKTEAVAEFVQNHIRYFVIEMGIGGFQPHPAADILRNGYGDCKDKATVLSSMLSTVGIHTALVIVDTHRGVVDPAAPSMIGNHMITAIEIPRGYESPRLRSVVTTATGRRYLIFDPTWDKTPFGQLESNLQGSYGVLLEGADTQAVQLPVLDPALNRLARTASFSLAPDGTLDGSVVEHRFGDAAERQRMLIASGTTEEQTQYRDHQLAADLTNFSVRDVKVENAAALNKDLTTTYQLSAEHYSRTMGPLLMVRVRVLGDEGFPLDRAGERTADGEAGGHARKVPFNLGETSLVEDDYSIAVPEGYAVDELPEPVSLDVGFAAYKSATAMEGNKLHYTRTYTVREVTVPADRSADLRKLAELIETDQANRAVLKKK